MAKFAPRVHVLLASEAPVGVVFRRGPSKQVCTLLWERETDQFTVGQWLKGRIYERRSDLSPDGKHLIYFAMNGKWKSEAKGSWTAISRTPYLKALAIFPKGDCWHGGGLFTGTSKYWLNDGYGHSSLRDSTEVKRDRKFVPERCFGGECPGVYYVRLLRDGWNLVELRQVRKWNDIATFEKPLPRGWMLRKLAHAQCGPPAGKGCYWDEHELVHDQTRKRIACPSWEWADRDGQRVVWVEAGKLFGASIAKDGLVDEKELMDFSPMTFEEIRAPY